MCVVKVGLEDRQYCVVTALVNYSPIEEISAVMHCCTLGVLRLSAKIIGYQFCIIRQASPQLLCLSPSITSPRLCKVQG